MARLANKIRRGRRVCGVWCVVRVREHPLGTDNKHYLYYYFNLALPTTTASLHIAGGAAYEQLRNHDTRARERPIAHRPAYRLKVT